MPSVGSFTAACLLLVLASPCALRAQGSGALQAAGQAPPAEEPEPQRTDVHDLLEKLRHAQPPPGEEAAPGAPERGTDLTLLPVIGASPSTGFEIGMGASVEFPLGDLRTTRVSQLETEAVVTTRNQLRTSATARLYGAGNRWYLDGDDHYMLTSIDTYALGTSAPGEPVRADYHSTHFFNALYLRLANGLYGGVGVNYGRQAHIRPYKGEEGVWDQSPFVTYSQRHGFDLDTQTAAGPTIGVFFDNRDSGIDATRGWYAGSNYRTYFNGFAGGSSTWQELYLDLRTYKALTKKRTRKLAFWTYADLVTGGTGPYLSLPSTGGDTQGRSGRGYADGQLRGERLVYGEAEYRATLTSNGLLGAVLFVNATTVSNRETGERLFDSVAPAAGFGVRVLLQKRSRTNICFDYGWGRSGARGFYLGLGEAF